MELRQMYIWKFVNQIVIENQHLQAESLYGTRNATNIIMTQIQKSYIH
jgi:hypothetical protein